MERKVVFGVVLTLFLVGVSMLAFTTKPASASATIYIRVDGSVDPPTAPISSFDNITYTFTDNIYDSIVIERDEIVVDGAGYTVEGTGGGVGIDLSGRNNVKVKNMEIKTFDYGVWLEYSSNSSIYRNNITTNPSNYAGIWLYESSNNDIYSNNMTNNYDAIYLESSSYNSIHGNNLTYNYRGLMLSSTFGVSSNNNIYGNKIIDNYHGIRLQYSSNNIMSQNYVTTNYFGIWLYRSSNNTISRNDIVANDYDGIRVEGSSHNDISGNQISNNYNGIEIRPYTGGPKSSNNTISQNNITANSYYGVWIYWSPNNTLFHNNLIDNNEQVHINYDSPNIWDNGYPSGGNYWSDYADADADGDGIGDTPYIIDADNQDNYPLMKPLSPIVGDVNADGIVDIFDIGYISAHWHPGPPAGPLGYDVFADINNDLAVDIFDIGIVSAHWGES